jgi:hypothetical protein
LISHEDLKQNHPAHPRQNFYRHQETGSLGTRSSPDIRLMSCSTLPMMNILDNGLSCLSSHALRCTTELCLLVTSEMLGESSQLSPWCHVPSFPFHNSNETYPHISSSATKSWNSSALSGKHYLKSFDARFASSGVVGGADYFPRSPAEIQQKNAGIRLACNKTRN